METDIKTLFYFYTRVYRQDRSAYTEKCSDWYFEKYIAPYLGSHKIGSVTPSEVQMVINRLKGKSRTAIALTYGDLMLVLKRAYVDGYTDKDLTGMIDKPKAKPTVPKRALTPLERETVISVAQTKQKYMAFLFMILCGCRPSEAYDMQKEDIDFENETVHIRGTKTALSDRVVPCPRIILNLAEKSSYGLLTLSQTGLKVNKEGQRTIWHSFYKDCHRYLGGTFYKGRPVEPYPFGKDLTAYNLRHEYCTELARHGVDVRITQKLMGHSSPEMTMKVYTNLSDEDVCTDEVRKIVNLKSVFSSLTE